MFLDLLADPVPMDPVVRDAEIRRLEAIDEPRPRDRLRLADLELDRARTLATSYALAVEEYRACPETCKKPDTLPADLFAGVFARYSELLKTDPETSGLEDAIVRVATADAAVWHAWYDVGGRGHGELAASERIDAWSNAFPGSDAVIIAELLYFREASRWCHALREKQRAATHVVTAAARTHEFLALERRLESPTVERLADFHGWLATYEGLIQHVEPDCGTDLVSHEYTCDFSSGEREAAWVRSMKLRAVPAFRQVLLQRFDLDTAQQFFWLLLELNAREEAEVVALSVEEAGHLDQAAWLWSYLSGWGATDAVASRARARGSALAEALGQGHRLVDLGERVARTDPLAAAELYLRAIAVGDRTGDYLYEVSPDLARERLLTMLARAWHQGGADERGERWFAESGRKDLWQAEVSRADPP